MFGAPVQIAYATDDVHAAARRWSERGIGPFFVIQHIALTYVEIDGMSGSFDHSSAYGQWGSVMVELIQQHDPGHDPVVGTSGIHHVASFVDDFEVASDALTADGFPRRLMATTSGGQAFAFHDARPTMGHLLEIYERTDRLAAFYAMVRDAATDWTGTDPVRVL
jgi:catechol 2,3-dioxygenase-like lactoylglutathione lyase family enzyme